VGGAHLFVVYGGEVDVDVDTIHQRSGNFRNIALNHRSGALAIAGAVVVEAKGAGCDGGHFAAVENGFRPQVALPNALSNCMLNFRVNSGGIVLRLALVWVSSLLACLSVHACAQSPDILEPGSVEAIAAATTDPHFVSPWVSYIPKSDTVPSPEKSLGRIMGAPGELLGTEKSMPMLEH
jgi:hypothetical protein